MTPECTEIEIETFQRGNCESHDLTIWIGDTIILRMKDVVKDADLVHWRDALRSEADWIDHYLREKKIENELEHGQVKE